MSGSNINRSKLERRLCRVAPGVIMAAFTACRASGDLADYSLSDVATSAWVDRSVQKEDDAISPCDWSNDARSIQCVFIERSTLKAWTLGLSIQGPEQYPELKTWPQADEYCRSLSQYGHVSGWRLPTIDEVQLAVLKEDGTYRSDALIGILDGVPALGPWPKYGLVWTSTPDPVERNSRFAVLRGPQSAPAAPSSVDRPKHWLCVADVSADSLRGDPLSRKVNPAVKASPPPPAAATRPNAKVETSAGTGPRSCQTPYPGRPDSKYRISSLFKNAIAANMNLDGASGLVGGFGQLVLSSLNGFRYDDWKPAADEVQRATLDAVVLQYVNAVREAVGIGKVVTFAVVGHASPTVDGQYLSPHVCTGQGVELNRGLGMNRATSVRDVLLRIFPELAGHVESESTGHHFPVVTNPFAANGRCGPYDCDASKRVEIFFYVAATTEPK